MKTYDEFFNWCEESRLKTDREIANALRTTNQTIKNWKKNHKGHERIPQHLILVAEGYDYINKNDKKNTYLDMSNTWFESLGLVNLEKKVMSYNFN